MLCTRIGLLRRRALVATTLLALAAGIVAVTAAPAGAASKRAPKRIVALTPFAANTLVHLHIKPLAIGQTLGGRERFSHRLRHVRTLPLSHPNGPNMEQLAALRPQLVFSSNTWRKGAQTMRRLDMRVVNADPVRVGRLDHATRLIGRKVGRPKAGRRLARKLNQRIRRASRHIERRPRVLMLLGVGRTPYAFLPKSWGGSLVRRAGGRLITGGVKSRSGFARISDEKIVEADPDIILAVPHANPDEIDAIRKSMLSNQLWKLTTAGQDGKIFVSTDNSLLQANTDVARVIRTVRKRYLSNW